MAGVVVLTGAGVSAESGIRTFRATDGLWEEHRIEEVATPEGFARAPDFVHRFYNARRRKLLEVRPNAAHKALAEFEARFDDNDNDNGDFLLITQNIDDLHERGGSRHLLHMHGELLKSRCADCGQRAPVTGDLSTADICESCGRAGAMRPDIVWFGEMPYFMEEIEAALSRCDLFVALGTSGAVYPAAQFVRTARQAGARCIQLNLEPTGGEEFFDETIYGKATETVPKFFENISAGERRDKV